MLFRQLRSVPCGRASGFDMIKAVLVFLLVMVLIGMVSNLIFPGSVRRSLTGKRRPAKPATCPRCGRFIIGSKGCDCKKGR
jgi:hypothetical protein